MPKIHALAAVEPGAEIGEGAEIGPFCVVGSEARIGAGTRLLSNVSVTGITTIGEQNIFYPFSSIGAEPQDISFRGEPARTEIGDRNTFREGVQVNRGTAKDQLLTKVGSDNLVMACCHIAHDCVIEDNVIMANNTLLGGHVHVESCVTFGGAAVVHHFVTVGRLAFIGGMTRVPKDVPPFMTLEGNPAKVWMVNKVGCDRRGITPESIDQLKEAHRMLFRSDMSWDEALTTLEARDDLTEDMIYLIDFCRRMQNLDGQKGRMQEARRTQKA